MVKFKGSVDVKKWLTWISEHHQKDVPEALAFFLYEADKKDELYSLVVNLCKKHDPIVQKLGFFINYYSIDKHQTEGD
tara:strand:+ start:167 stop:400 length:234 start_codon:yes stop_codon:yes gene_type:complete